MSNSENISRWKKRSEIDYIPLFISLWLALNTWMRDRFNEDKDRGRIELLKTNDDLKDKFTTFIRNDNIFKGHFADLHRSLENTHIDDFKNKKISFTNAIIEWNNGDINKVSVIKKKAQHRTIHLVDELYLDNDIDLVFFAYIENLYQVRCALFHGNLPLTLENERVLKCFYLTLSMIMDHIQ